MQRSKGRFALVLLGFGALASCGGEDPVATSNNDASHSLAAYSSVTVSYSCNPEIKDPLCEPPSIPENFAVSSAIDLRNGTNGSNSQWLSWTYPDPQRPPVAYLVFYSLDNITYRVAGEVLSNAFSFQNNGTLPPATMVYYFVRASQYPVLDRVRTTHGSGADSIIVNRKTELVRRECVDVSSPCL